jgi:asparagine synthase (glutamine-hydrolysing)
MCGICGWFGPACAAGPELTAAMTAPLRHRGPDDVGTEGGDGWGLGFRRLSILDLSPLGHQPMRSPDGSCWLAFNGEIYNYLELRRELEQAGEVFRSGSDTEVLLRLLMRRGAEALPRLNGMFALAFVDTRRRSFLLARDRLGVKPLYCQHLDGRLRFASELKALLACPDAPREINRSAVAQYLALGYLPGETCIFEGYWKLPPGHVLSGSIDRPHAASMAPYWELTLNDDPTQRSATPAELDELEGLLFDAVRIRLRSDVPVGVFLSGGIDSGLVAAMAAKTGQAPLALTVGFAEEDWDESALARATASHAGLEHRLIPQRAGGLGDLDRLAWFFDEPFGDPSALPTFTLSEAAASHATVFLSGDGGDEAFGGYRRYVECLRRESLIRAAGRLGPALDAASRLLPRSSLIRYQLSKLSLPDLGCSAVFDALPDDPVMDHVVHPQLRPFLRNAGRPVWERWNESEGAALTVRQQKLDYSLYLPDDVLVKVDRASMAHSIEVRSPLLDVRIVDWAARLPRKSLLDRSQGKLPLRALAGRFLPEAARQSPKRGFGVPLGDWFRASAGRAMVKERLLDAAAGEWGLWSRSGVQRILDIHNAGRRRDFGLLLWRLMMLEAWCRHYAADPVRHRRAQLPPQGAIAKEPRGAHMEGIR